MSVTSEQADRFVVLYGVPWDTYEGILDALDEHYLRHTYVEGTLEMRALVNGVSWQQYKRFLEALSDYNLRHSYDGWTLELMSPRKDHDWVKSILGRMVETMAYELNIPIQSVGSTTLTGDSVERGLQPDESYYVANESKVRGKSTYDPDFDPPPDLTIEVDVTHSSVKRLPLFAALAVPEVWRYDGQRVIFYRRGKSRKYTETQRSVSFPFLSPADVTRFLEKHTEMDENSLVRSFAKWAMQQYREHTNPQAQNPKKRKGR